VPLSAIVAGEFVALLATLTLAPLTAPAAVGAKVTVSVADWPDVRIVPLETPLVLNPAPVTVTPEMVTFEFPVLVNEVVNELVPPTFTLPNERLVGLAPSNCVAACPVPERLIASDEGAPFVVRVIEPVTAPDEDGSNVALKVALAPAAIVVDVLRPVCPNPEPETLICENVSVASPLLVNVIDCDFVLPIATVPKLTLVGLAAI
jgi:hypothetical protein